jgi:hypothetical protein
MSRGPPRIGLVWWLILGLILCAAVGRAQQPTPPLIRIIGQGTLSCGSWVSERRKGPAAWEPLPYESWILGFLSGIGVGSNGALNPLQGVDAEAVWAWIDNYCQAHPLEHRREAGSAFVTAHPR